MVSGKVSEDNPSHPQRVGMPKIPGGYVCAAFTVISCGSSVVAASNVAALLLLLLLVMFCSRRFFVSAASRVRLSDSVSTSTSKLQLSFLRIDLSNYFFLVGNCPHSYWPVLRVV